MIIFNPHNKTELSFNECLEPAMKIIDKNEAVQYKKDYIAYIEHQLIKEPRDDTKSAQEIAEINLGYFAGYYSNEVQSRVEKLFGCKHPWLNK